MLGVVFLPQELLLNTNALLVALQNLSINKNTQAQVYNRRSVKTFRVLMMAWSSRGTLVLG